MPILGGKPLLAMNFHDMEVRIAPANTIRPRLLLSPQRCNLVTATRLELGLHPGDPVQYPEKGLFALADERPGANNFESE